MALSGRRSCVCRNTASNVLRMRYACVRVAVSHIHNRVDKHTNRFQLTSHRVGVLDPKAVRNLKVAHSSMGVQFRGPYQNTSSRFQLNHRPVSNSQ